MIHSEVRGVDIVVEGLEHVTNGVRKAAMLGVIEALQVAHGHAHEMISASDHSLADLALMGHPYGFVHPQVIHEPDEIVHAQSGEYLDALKVQKPRSYADGAIVEGEVGIDPDNAAMQTLDNFIQNGTVKMRARRWSERVADEYGDEIAAPIEDRIQQALDAEGAA